MEPEEKWGICGIDAFPDKSSQMAVASSFLSALSRCNLDLASGWSVFRVPQEAGGGLGGVLGSSCGMFRVAQNVLGVL